MSAVEGNARIYAKLSLVAVVWGASFIAGRIVSAEMDATSAALWRYIVALLTLVAVALAVEHGLPRLTPRQWFGVMVLGILGVKIYNVSLAATTYAALAGTLMLVAINAGTGNLHLPHVSPKVWRCIAFIGTCSTALAYVWFYDGVRAIGPARTAVFINLVPVVAIALGVLLPGEKLLPSMVIGAALVVSGVFIIHRAPATSQVRHVPAHIGW